MAVFVSRNESSDRLLAQGRDVHGMYVHCLQCGYLEDTETTSVAPVTATVHRARRRSLSPVAHILLAEVQVLGIGVVKDHSGDRGLGVHHVSLRQLYIQAVRHLQ